MNTCSSASPPSHHVPDGIDRREALRRIGVLVGGALSSSLVAGVLGGCRAETRADWQPAVLSRDQHDFVVAVTEHIIPETDTLGATAAYVDRYIDKMLGEWYPLEERDTFLSGLDGLDERVRSEYGQRFAACDDAEQEAIVTVLDEAAFEDEAPSQEARFFRQLKALTVTGYFTSEVPGTEVLRWVPAPGYYDGCASFDDIGATWVNSPA